MNRIQPLLLFALALTPSSALAQWTAPTPEELSMTFEPQAPGAPAVYLYREETTVDEMHLFSVYVRLKVLTEKGKELGTIELPYVRSSDGSGKTVEDIAGRTIHSDGTIIPFTGKPLEKMVQKSADYKVMTKVFSMPAVEVGSILEYRYKFRMDDHFFEAPNWYVQSGLFTRKAHYMWKPTDKELVDNSDGQKLTSAIAWSPLLPPGVNLKQSQVVGAMGHDKQNVFELDVKDIPPAPEEEYMPPIRSFSYRVLFYYTPYRTVDEYWKAKGKSWSKGWDAFIGHGGGVAAEVQRVTAASDTPDQKLRKLYADVMQMENTDFTRARRREEEKAGGLREVRNADDVLARRRGSSDQLAALYIGMARAAGVKAYVGAVTNRDSHVFLQNYLNMGQLDDLVAIVAVDGKEHALDPGSRYCAYGQLAWKHTRSGGIRQAEGGTAFFYSPIDLYTESRVDRVGDLKMDEHGVVDGTVKITYRGAPALRWRQASLTGDEESVSRDLRVSTERMLPGGMEVKLRSMEHLTEYEQPLVATFDVKGNIGSSTGKRLIVPATLFEVNTRPAFTHEKRETPVYFNYSYTALDAVRITLPQTLAIESVPGNSSEKLRSVASYSLVAEQKPASVTMRRSMLVGEVLFPAKDYGELRSFYSKVENKDQESIVLTRVAEKTGAVGN